MSVCNSNCYKFNYSSGELDDECFEKCMPNMGDCQTYLFVMMTIVGGCICLIGLICNVISLYAFCHGVVYTPTSYRSVNMAGCGGQYIPAHVVCVPGPVQGNGVFP